MHATLLLLAALFVSPAGVPDPQAAGPTGATGDQGVPASPANPPAPAPAAPVPPTPEPSAPNAGQGLPPRAVPATSDTAIVRVAIRLEADLQPNEVLAGLMTTPEQTSQRIVPTVEVVTKPAPKETPSLELRVGRLIPFGEMTVPLLYRGKQVETLQFLKAGLAIHPPAEGPIVAHEDDGLLLLVLENTSAEEYKKVGVRVRFQDIDVCTATGDQPTGQKPAAGPSEPDPWWWRWLSWLGRQGKWLLTPPDWLQWLIREPVLVTCSPVDRWATFHIRPASQVSLWVPTPPQWYLDRQSGLARSATRHGLVTLRFFDDAGTTVAAEQNLPFDARFEPTTGNLWWSIGWIGFLLLCGALLFLVMRVSIPNYRRKKTLKQQLNEARTATATISNQVDSQLRVLVRVERLVLEQRRRDGWVMLPGFDEQAKRIEAGLATLNRKIGFVQRLDTIACQREALADGPVAPTRLDILDRDTSAACEALKADQLGDADWLFIQQRLEAAGKILNEPTTEEKQAFEALIIQRWQALRNHFGVTEDAQEDIVELTIPGELKTMADCFPRGTLLPRKGDDGVKKWIESVGVVRADLQLTALEMVREVQFLAPRQVSDEWERDMRLLAKWLATPAVPNLCEARRLLRQIAEGVKESAIVQALSAGKADIEMDPQVVGPNQTVRLSIRFRDPKLQGATARAAVQCEWVFAEPTMDAFGSRLASLRERAPRWIARRREPAAPVQAPLPPVDQIERGWRVYRYFEPGVKEQKISVRFTIEGERISVNADAKSTYEKTVHPVERSSSKKESREKWARFTFQTVQMLAALLVPLATLAITTAGEPTSGRWWDLIGIGFGSEAIRNILTGEQPTN